MDSFSIFAQIFFMKQKTILSTALLPNIDYMSALIHADEVKIEKHESYKKQSYRNRYNIVGPNGLHALTIPVNKNGLHNCPISDLRISYDNNWLKMHWKTWETAYNSSPFFLYFKDDFKNIFEKKHSFLWDLNQEFLSLILEILEIDKKIEFTRAFQKDHKEYMDLREVISPKKAPFCKKFTKYYQVFETKNGFVPNLSIIDLIFNMGNESVIYIP